MSIEARNRILADWFTRIPYDEMIAGDYQTVSNARASLMHSAMTKLCGGGT
jgi:hypothetical protein